MSDAGFAPTIARFSGGFADNYDRCRAEPPAVLADYLGRLAGSSPPDLVVDLGSGTGLSTRYWAERARRVVGVEPSDEMRALAEARTSRANVSYRRGFSHRTALADRSADVAFCMQALHWMDPQRTFDEAARILRPGGVFAACDYDWPPATGASEADAAWLSCSALGQRLEREKGVDAGLLRWDKPGHLARMAGSGRFRFTRELSLHHEDQGDAERFIGLLMSQAYVPGLLKAGLSREELGLDAFEAVVRRVLGSAPSRWLWSARVVVGVV